MLRTVEPSDDPNNAIFSCHRWGIILAGGDGLRLREIIYRSRADHLPKQYVNFVGTRSMLEHTIQRAEKLIAPQRLLVVISAAHLQFEDVRRQTTGRYHDRVIVQPNNRDTGPGILLPLWHLYKRDAAAIVAFFPSDHFILQEELFMRHVERACEVVESSRGSIVLLGAEPTAPDAEYGYLLPHQITGNASFDGYRTIEKFIEKPSAEVAQLLIAQGALWNTFVFVAACKTLLAAIESAVPELYRSFAPIAEAIGTPQEEPEIQRVYRNLRPFNFSKGVLEPLSIESRGTLLVQALRDVFWSDWGNDQRLSSGLELLRTAGLFRMEHERFPQEILPTPPGKPVVTAIKSMR